MKKVIGLMMVLVMMFAFMSNVYAKEIADVSASEGYGMVKEWAEAQGWIDWYNEQADSFVVHGCGAVSVKDYESETGMDWSMDNFEQSIIDHFDLCECRIKQVGEIEGNNIYIIEAQSETTVLGKIWNDDKIEEFYCVSMLFMVCE